MKAFLQGLLKFSIIPILLGILSVCSYYNADPYFDFSSDNHYSWTYSFQNIGDLSTKKLLKSNQNYNSFIFGSSRVVDLYACYLNSKFPNSSFFHYAGWSEPIAGIKNKLEIVDSLNYSIKNVIIYIDVDYSFKLGNFPNYSDHYLVVKKSKRRGRIIHYQRFWQNISYDKIKILLGFKRVKGHPYRNSDPTTNDHDHLCKDFNVRSYSKINRSDSIISRIDRLTETGFYYERNKLQQYAKDQISKGEEVILNEIKEIFDKHSTNFYIVITPLYDQRKFSQKDQVILKNIFGSRLYDFSGINDITNDKYNFPDRKHFQPYISKAIIDSILNKDSSIDFQSRFVPFENLEKITKTEDKEN